MSYEIVVKERLQQELNDGFPEGKSLERGNALMLFAVAMSEITKTITAFGGCQRCYGKGYATQLIGLHGASDFMMGEKGFEEAPSLHINFCDCKRGEQLKDIAHKLKEGKVKFGDVL